MWNIVAEEIPALLYALLLHLVEAIAGGWFSRATPSQRRGMVVHYLPLPLLPIENIRREELGISDSLDACDERTIAEHHDAFVGWTDFRRMGK